MARGRLAAKADDLATSLEESAARRIGIAAGVFTITWIPAYWWLPSSTVMQKTLLLLSSTMLSIATVPAIGFWRSLGRFAAMSMLLGASAFCLALLVRGSAHALTTEEGEGRASFTAPMVLYGTQRLDLDKNPVSTYGGNISVTEDGADVRLESRAGVAVLGNPLNGTSLFAVVEKPTRQACAAAATWTTEVEFIASGFICMKTSESAYLILELLSSGDEPQTYVSFRMARLDTGKN